MRMALTTVHAGWLTKSPPEKKLQGPLKFFKAHWRRRYFILSTSQAQSPTSYGDDPPSAYLHYYDNDKNPKKSRKKGCIDLTSCEEILAQLDSVFYEHVFSLRTQDRGRSRTYYLAADSVEDMNRWISCLCRVLRMDDNDSSLSTPDQFSSPLSVQNFSVPNRKTSVASRNQVLYPMQQQQQQQQSPGVTVPPSCMPPPGHYSLVFDYPSSYSQSDELMYTPHGSQSYYPPTSGSCYFPEAVSLPDSDSPPPSLPAKSNLRRAFDRLDPCSHQLLRMSEYSNSSDYNDPVFDFQRNRSCKSYVESGEYDMLPRRFDDDGDCDDYDFPPPARSGITSVQPFPPDDNVQRASTSSYPDVFDHEGSDSPLPVSQSSGLSPIQMSSRTRSFRRSISRSDPPVSVLEPHHGLEELKSNSGDEEQDEQLQEHTKSAAVEKSRALHMN